MGKYKAAFETLGCRVNIYDTESMQALFKKDGYEIVPFGEKADVYVINTCTVTNQGDKKSRQMIKRAKKLNEDAVICVVGCYAQVAREEIEKMEEVSVILGSRNKSLSVSAVNRALATGEKTIEVSEVLKDDVFEDLGIEDTSEHTRAFLKIQDGCGRFCSYCMIPYARGKSVSRERKKILSEIRALKEHGFKEIILSGIHLASWGNDFIKADAEEKKMNGEGILLSKKEEPSGLLDLLEDIETIEGIERVRIGSIEPMFFDEEGTKRAASLKKLCPHFHLSLQSGSDSVLKRMNRRYTPEEYKDAVERLRKAIPGVSVTTDIIVGFPGETEEEFNETLKFLKDIKLTKTHVFRYSSRKGTPAAIMKDQVDGSVKEERSRILLELSDKNERDFMESMTGKKERVLIEELKDGYARGYTANYLPFVIPYDEIKKALSDMKKSDKKSSDPHGESDIEGKIFEVEITGIINECLTGHLIQQSI